MAKVFRYYTDSAISPYKLLRMVTPEEVDPNSMEFLSESKPERWSPDDDSWFAATGVKSALLGGDLEALDESELDGIKQKIRDWLLRAGVSD